MRVATVALMIGCGAIARAQPQSEPIAQRIIGRNIIVNLPLGPCDVPNLVLFVAKDVGAPAGGEFLPVCGYGYKDRPPITERIPLLAMRVGEAIELLTKVDPRYHIMESDGVMVVRPLQAWINHKHFLNRTIDKLEMTDENIGGALEEVLAPFWNRGRSRTLATLMSGFGKLTLSVGPVSAVEALDAIVRTHGAARWEIRYCDAVPEVAADLARVFLYTYDDRGIGAPVAPLRQVNGKPVKC